ncbi:MAG: hypothetical protein Roseis2KO_58320 [Roseivirga sp.]
MSERVAIIDLGTNTFHLFIVEMDGEKINTLYKEKIAVKVGKNGISKGKIAADARKRAIHTLKIFRTVIDLFEVHHVKGVATSAIRSAKNGQELIDEIREKTEIEIDIISGSQEAELIFRGVQAAMEVPPAPQLVMDIGGGSVEFIIGTDNEILWRHSFEIGAQRLLDKFHKEDPMPEESILAMDRFLKKNLQALAEAISAHQPTGLIGCSGTFDTLTEIYLKKIKQERDLNAKIHSLPVAYYEQIHQDLVLKNREERLTIPGMVTMRVDMIVVASYLIRFVLDQIATESITACSYALKEGLLYSSFEEKIATDLKVTQ